MLTQAEKEELIRLKKLLLQIESARLHAIRAREGAREYSDAAKAAAAAAVGTKRNREDDSGSESESEKYDERIASYYGMAGYRVLVKRYVPSHCFATTIF